MSLFQQFKFLAEISALRFESYSLHYIGTTSLLMEADKSRRLARQSWERGSLRLRESCDVCWEDKCQLKPIQVAFAAQSFDSPIYKLWWLYKGWSFLDPRSTWIHILWKVFFFVKVALLRFQVIFWAYVWFCSIYIT